MGGERKRLKLSPQNERVDERDTSSHNLLRALRDSQTSSSQRRLLVHTLRDVLSSKLLPPLLETQPKPVNLRHTDKCFACAWVSDQYVVVGTKCNKLLCVDAATLHMQNIPLPSKPARPRNLPPSATNCGIHSMAVSPDGSMLAVGGSDPSDCQIYQIQHHIGSHPTFTPSQSLVGHQDWLFGMTWLTNRHIVTASRDQSVKLWCNDEQVGATIYKPLETRLQHKTKVRDVRYCRDTLRLATLGTDGVINLWDPNLLLLQSVGLTWNKEVVCMAMTPNLLAVGSQSHVSLLDPRMPQALIRAITSIDPGQGVRSVGIMDRILSSGSGRGRIAFFDLRAHDYISVQQEALSRPQTPIAPQSLYVPPTEGVLQNSIYDFADFDDFYDEEDIDDDEDNEYSDVEEEEDEVSEHDDVNQDNSVNQNGDINEDSYNGDVVNGATPAIQDIPAWQHQPPGPPSFRRPMPVPTASSFQPAQPQYDYVLSPQANLWLQMGNGWLDHNHVYMDHFTGMQIWNACYAHAWDPTKTKLFSCGGPLAFGLIGSYMGLWN